MSVLTREFILEKTRAPDLAAVRNLNFWGSDIEDVSILRELPNLEVVSGSVNKVSELGWFKQCFRLSELYLRKNKIGSLMELEHIRDLPNLSVLWLDKNPCAEDEEYREFTIAILPRLTKLDGIDITVAERSEAEANFTRKHPDLVPSPPRQGGRPPSSGGRPPSGLTPRGESPGLPPRGEAPGLPLPSPRQLSPRAPREPSPRPAREVSPRGVRDPSPRGAKVHERRASPRGASGQPEKGRAKMSPRSNSLRAALLMLRELPLDELFVVKTEIDSQIRRLVTSAGGGI